MALSLDSVAMLARPFRARWLPRAPPSIATLTVALLVLGAALRAWAAVGDQGLVWPDEVFQTMEQAHRWAFGRGIVPWEFREGARSWVFPGLIGVLWKGAAAVGVSTALGLVCVAKLSMAAASLWGAWAGTVLARRLGGERAMLLAALFGAICPPLVIFGSRCATETASAPLVVVAALLIETRPRARRAALAGALVALAVLFRYQNGLVAVGFFITLLVRGRLLDTLAYVVGALPVAAAGGAVDWLTWGKPFSPLMVYVKFNTTAGELGPERWGVAPFTFFADHLATTVGIGYGLLALGFLVATRRSPALVFVVTLFVLVHCRVPHKELRFIMPIIPLAVSLSAVGLAQLMDGLRRGVRPTYVLALSMGSLMAWQLRAPTLADLGYGTDAKVVWHANEDYYRAGLAAAAAPDLCGLSYSDCAHAWTGGYTYLHRDVPVFYGTDPRDLAAANYLVGNRDAKLPAAWKSVGVFGAYALWHKDGACGPLPPWYTLDQL